MDGGAHKLLESAVHRTLHANNFSRTSSQASLVLTDLFARYLTLLSSSCAKYAEHAGRRNITARDAACALDELGVSIEELGDFYKVEGHELSRYAIKSLRRVEDLNEFRAHLQDGLRQDTDDAIPLEYRPYSPGPEEDVDEEVLDDNMSIDTEEDFGNGPILNGHHDSPSKHGPQRQSSPPLPLSPISNPSSPSRKRFRNLDWHPPLHIPDFLPPFPAISDHAPEPSSELNAIHVPSELPPPTLSENAQIDKPPVPLAQDMTSAAASDFLHPIPYSQSSLSLVSEWHLPSIRPELPEAEHITSLPTEPALIGAYHHVLTNQPGPNPNAANPARHKVAMTLLGLTHEMSRWDLPDTLYSNLAPNLPRVSAMPPVFPVQLSGPPLESNPRPPKHISPQEQLSHHVSRQGSRISELAVEALPHSVYGRITQLPHPVPLRRGDRLLTYGLGIPAPWNSTTSPEGVSGTPVSGKPKDGYTPMKPQPILRDAKLYAAWEYDTKDFREPLSQPSNTKLSRARITSSASASSPRERRLSRV